MSDSDLVAFLVAKFSKPSWKIAHDADSSLVSGEPVGSYQNGLLAVDADLKVQGPGLELSTYGLTVFIDLPEGHFEGRCWGGVYAQTLSAGAGLWMKLPSGRHTASCLAAVTVKLSEDHYTIWQSDPVPFSFNVP